LSIEPNPQTTNPNPKTQIPNPQVLHNINKNNIKLNFIKKNKK